MIRFNSIFVNSTLEDVERFNIGISRRSSNLSLYMLVIGFRSLGKMDFAKLCVCLRYGNLT